MPETSSVAGEDKTEAGSGYSLARNVSVSSASFLISLAIAFVMLPAMVHRLGVQRYGLWMLAGEFAGYSGYFDLGIRNAVTYYVALYAAQRSSRDLNEVVATAFWSVSILGVLISAAGWGIARVFPLLFDIPAGDISEIQSAVILLIISVGVSLPVEVLNSVLNGHRRIDTSILIDTAGRVVAAIVTLICLFRGRGLVALAVIQLAAELACLVSAWIAVRRLLPDVSFHPGRYVRYACLRRLAGFGIPSLLISLSRLAISRADLVMVGMILGVRAAALYSIPRSLVEYAYNGVRWIGASCSAHFTHVYAERRTADLMALYRQASRLSGVAVFLLAAWIAVFGHSFLAVWQGPDFVSGPWRQRADVALLLLVAAFLPRMLAGMTLQLFIATGRLSFVLWITTLEAAGKIVLSLWLIRIWGLAGAAVANLIPMAIFEGFTVAVYLFHIFPALRGSFVAEALGRPLLVGVVACAAGLALTSARQPADWPVFLAEAAVAAVVGLSFAFLVGIGAEERRAVRSYVWKQ